MAEAAGRAGKFRRALKLNTKDPTITLPRYHIAVSFPKKRHMKRIFLFLVTNLAVLALLTLVIFIVERVFGARRNAALVAVSSGLLRSMARPQVEAVLGHEISHVANGDMVTLALLQGVLNTFVIFLARIIGSFWYSRRREFRADRGGADLAGVGGMIAGLLNIRGHRSNVYHPGNP